MFPSKPGRKATICKASEFAKLAGKWKLTEYPGGAQCTYESNEESESDDDDKEGKNDNDERVNDEKAENTNNSDVLVAAKRPRKKRKVISSSDSDCNGLRVNTTLTNGYTIRIHINAQSILDSTCFFPKFSCPSSGDVTTTILDVITVLVDVTTVFIEVTTTIMDLALLNMNVNLLQNIDRM